MPQEKSRSLQPNMCLLGLQVAGKQMVKLIPHLVNAKHTMGIDAESGHVGELTAEQVAMAATTAFDRAVQVRKASSLTTCHRLLAASPKCCTTQVANFNPDVFALTSLKLQPCAMERCSYKTSGACMG